MADHIRGWQRGICLAVTLFWGAIAAHAEPLRIVAFGDSLMAGYGLPLEDGYPAQMERWLQANGVDAVVVNASVSGDTTAGGLARIEWTLADPADAIMIELGANDMLRALDPAMTRSNLDGILKIARSKGLPILLAGMRAPGNYGDEYLNEFNAIYPDLAATYEARLYPQFLQGLSKAGASIAEIAKVIQSDGLHPNKDGVALIVQDMGPVLREWIKGFAPLKVKG